MNFKTLILLSLILLGGICTGCDRFLDVQPKDQYTEKQLLATRGGYYTAMNGLYNNLTSNSLYGKNLSYELIDVISKRYAPLAKSTYLTSLLGICGGKCLQGTRVDLGHSLHDHPELQCHPGKSGYAAGHTVPGRNQSDEGRITGPPGFPSFRHVTLIRPHL